jgi:uncharacterized MAPEG superfamily protein
VSLNPDTVVDTWLRLAIDALALTFILARVAYGICYITDRSTLRSLVWLVGFGCTVALFVTAA